MLTEARGEGDSRQQHEKDEAVQEDVSVLRFVCVCAPVIFMYTYNIERDSKKFAVHCVCMGASTTQKQWALHIHKYESHISSFFLSFFLSFSLSLALTLAKAPGRIFGVLANKLLIMIPNYCDEHAYPSHGIPIDQLDPPFQNNPKLIPPRVWIFILGQEIRHAPHSSLLGCRAPDLGNCIGV
mmetsp:Transcript_19839/g.41587  ORF Transcript_19839/g.41587 Transcript_19839/m.41587 type:complete len:183 (+) Transcript_19839:1107-1655(+)